MTTTRTAPAARDYAAEYVTARVAVRSAFGIAATYAAETAAQKIVDEAERAGVDLYPDLLDLDEAARVAAFGTYTDAELRDMLADPFSRTLARAELARRSA